MKTIARIAGIVLLLGYIFSLTVVAVQGFGIAGLLAIPFFMLFTVYQIITHVLVGDFLEVITILLWLITITLLLNYSRD